MTVYSIPGIWFMICQQLKPPTCANTHTWLTKPNLTKQRDSEGAFISIARSVGKGVNNIRWGSSSERCSRSCSTSDRHRAGFINSSRLIPGQGNAGDTDRDIQGDVIRAVTDYGCCVISSWLGWNIGKQNVTLQFTIMSYHTNMRVTIKRLIKRVSFSNCEVN